MYKRQEQQYARTQLDTAIQKRMSERDRKKTELAGKAEIRIRRMSAREKRRKLIQLVPVLINNTSYKQPQLATVTVASLKNYTSSHTIHIDTVQIRIQEQYLRNYVRKQLAIAKCVHTQVATAIKEGKGTKLAKATVVRNNNRRMLLAGCCWTVNKVQNTIQIVNANKHAYPMLTDFADPS